jgi:hypothetical protein
MSARMHIIMRAMLGQGFMDICVKLLPDFLCHMLHGGIIAER